jgi:predicted nuclease of predicted toxin-antitoxin system
VKVLLDEMYPAALAMALRDKGIDAVTVAELGLTGRPDVDVFAGAIESGYAVLTENVSDFARIASEHVAAGEHHQGVLIALSSRFSRRPAGYGAIVVAVAAVAAEQLDDRLVYLEHSDQT